MPSDEPQILVDCYAASKSTKVPASTIRTWAERGHLGQHGRDAHGRVLYDLAEVHRHRDTSEWEDRATRQAKRSLTGPDSG